METSHIFLFNVGTETEIEKLYLIYYSTSQTRSILVNLKVCVHILEINVSHSKSFNFTEYLTNEGL